MKSVYSRIFVTVIIASLLMLGLGTAVSFLMVSQRIERLAGQDAAHVAAAAAAAIDHGGESALRDWLRRRMRASRQRPGAVVGTPRGPTSSAATCPRGLRRARRRC
ncbi:MAG: hypothetical protein U1F11_15170 [Steroidobacteraceae bacterium]